MYNLENLLPEDLEIIKKLIDDLLPKISSQKITNQKYQIKNKEIRCVRCNSEYCIKNGHKNGTQRYKCKECNCFFSITTNTILSHSTLSYEKLIKFIECLINCYSIEKTSFETELSKSEVYKIRLKILNILSNYYDDTILSGVIQVDEKYIRISFKGTRANKMPRDSRRNGYQDRTSGISKEQVCVIVAIDSNDNIIIKVAGNGPATTEMLENTLKNKVKENSILITDSKSSYIKFAKCNSLILKQIPHNKHIVDSIYHLGELNSLMSEMEIFIQNFRGLSTRHLQQYLDLFRFRKILKYTVEYMKQKNTAYKFSIIQNSTLKNADIHKTAMPVNVKDIYNKDFV